MDSSELCRFMMDKAGQQLVGVLRDLPASSRDKKVAGVALTPSETIEHLCEAYTAAKAEAVGQKHSWGTFAIEDKSWDNLMSTLTRLRSEAVEALSNSTDEHVLKEAVDYIALHDAYHVGQLCTLRLNTEPDWDGYQIYK